MSNVRCPLGGNAMKRRHLVFLALCLAVNPSFAADCELTNFRFGIIRPVSKKVFEFVSETTVIPRRYKDSGFRFGVGFDNPNGTPIEWYEVVYLPSDLKQLSGNFQRTSTKTLRTRTFRSSRTSVVDDFWFDKGDPIGKHRLELYVNNVLRYSVDFEVVEDK